MNKTTRALAALAMLAGVLALTSPAQAQTGRQIAGLGLLAGTDHIEALWQAPDDAPPNYRLAYREVGGDWQKRTTTETTYRIEGLSAGTEYEVRVRGRYSGSDWGPWSATQRITTEAQTAEPDEPIAEDGEGQGDRVARQSDMVVTTDSDSVVLVSNLNQTPTSDANQTVSDGDYQGFHRDPDADAAVLLNVELKFGGFTGGADADDLTVSLRGANDDDEPDDEDLVVLDNPDLSTTGDKIFAVPSGERVISPVGVFFVYFSFDDASHGANFGETASNSEDSGGYEDWTVQNESSEGDDNSLLVRINGTALNDDTALGGLSVSVGTDDLALSPAYDADTRYYSVAADADVTQVTLDITPPQHGEARVHQLPAGLGLSDADTVDPGFQVDISAGVTSLLIRTNSEAQRSRVYHLDVFRGERILVSNLGANPLGYDDTEQPGASVIFGAFGSGTAGHDWQAFSTGPDRSRLRRVGIALDTYNRNTTTVSIRAQKTDGTGPADDDLVELVNPTTHSVNNIAYFAVPADSRVLLQPESTYYLYVTVAQNRGALKAHDTDDDGEDAAGLADWTIADTRRAGNPVRIAVVGKLASTDAALTSLSVSDGTNDVALSPAFAADELSYTVSVEDSVSQVTVSHEVHEDATWVIQDADDNDLDDLDDVALGFQAEIGPGTTNLQIVVTSEAQTTRTYRISIQRGPAPERPNAVSLGTVSGGASQNSTPERSTVTRKLKKVGDYIDFDFSIEEGWAVQFAVRGLGQGGLAEVRLRDGKGATVDGYPARTNTSTRYNRPTIYYTYAATKDKDMRLRVKSLRLPDDSTTRTGGPETFHVTYSAFRANQDEPKGAGVGDFRGDRNTRATLVPSDTLDEYVSVSGAIQWHHSNDPGRRDEDWYRVELEANTKYQVFLAPKVWRKELWDSEFCGIPGSGDVCRRLLTFYGPEHELAKLRMTLALVHGDGTQFKRAGNTTDGRQIPTFTNSSARTVFIRVTGTATGGYELGIAKRS